MTHISKRFVSDERGASIIEFALLAPVFIGLLMGVLTIGIYMQNYNAVRSLAADAARFAAVEYQKNVDWVDPETTLEDNIAVMGSEAPYNLASSRLTVDVVEDTSPDTEIPGARQFELNLSYALPDIVGGISIDNVTLTYSRRIFVLA